MYCKITYWITKAQNCTAAKNPQRRCCTTKLDQQGLMSCLQQADIRDSIILAPILTLASFQLLNTPLLLSLLWFPLLGVHLISAVPLSSCRLLSSAPAHLLGQSQWPTSLRCIYPYLAPQTRWYLLGTGTQYGLGVPSPTKSWTSLSSLQQVDQSVLSSSPDRRMRRKVMVAEVTWLPLLDCDREVGDCGSVCYLEDCSPPS